MAFDEGLAQQVREVLADRKDVVEKKMFGGLAFMVAGNMCVAVKKDEILLRVGPDQQDELSSFPHSRPMEHSGKLMKGFFFIDRKGFEKGKALEKLLERSLQFVTALPPK